MFIKVKPIVLATVYRQRQKKKTDTMTRGQSKNNIQDRKGKGQNWKTARTLRNQPKQKKQETKAANMEQHSSRGWQTIDSLPSQMSK